MLHARVGLRSVPPSPQLTLCTRGVSGMHTPTVCSMPCLACATHLCYTRAAVTPRASTTVVAPVQSRVVRRQEAYSPAPRAAVEQHKPADHIACSQHTALQCVENAT